jgi:glutamine amidotransferase-like uncharacterized protein
MKISSTIVLCLNLILLFSNSFCQEKRIRVAIYNDVGGGGAGAENIELCLSDELTYSTKRVDAEDIRSGILRSFDVIVQAGGRGSKQAAMLEPGGVDSIRQFVKRGGGYLGICAGAYLATVEYPWSLHILNAVVVDREHWNRGEGFVDLNLSPEGQKFFGVDDETFNIQYGQGPLLAHGDSTGLPQYKELATYATEIAKNDAPEGIMSGTTAIAQGEFGAGRVVAVSPHPEKSPKLRHMILTMVKWLARRYNAAESGQGE